MPFTLSVCAVKVGIEIIDLYDPRVSIHDAAECDVDSLWQGAGLQGQVCDRLLCSLGDG